MEPTDILGLITLGIMLIAVLLAVFALLVPTENKVGNRLLAGYLLILAVTISVFFYYPFYSPPLVIEKLRDDINLLSSPLFYLFVLSVLYRDFRLRPQDLWHLLPFVLMALLFTPRFYAVSESARTAYFHEYYDHWEPYAAMVLSHLQAIGYLTVTFFVLARYRKVLRENYSDASAVRHRWLWQTNVLLCVLFAFSLFKNIFKRFVGDYDLTTWVRIGMVSLLLGFLCWLLLKIMLHPGLFRGIASTDKPLPAANHGGAAAGAGNGQRTARLREHMETERPYLEPTLTVKDLADQLAWPERELSVLINQELGRHFFDFVNDYRIEHAKTLLRDPVNDRMTVLEILYAVGFNSKSSFNVAFKNRTGKTPTQYRKNIDNQPLAKSRTPVGQ